MVQQPKQAGIEHPTSERVVSHSELETIDCGKRFAERLRPGDVLALFGELGSGKTRFAQGICRGLGVQQEHVTSPTFTLINEYHSPKADIFHFDCYRLNSINELYQLGFTEYVAGDGICIIEWAERAEGLLPEHYYKISFGLGNNENERMITIEKEDTDI